MAILWGSRDELKRLLHFCGNINRDVNTISDMRVCVKGNGVVAESHGHSVPETAMAIVIVPTPMEPPLNSNLLATRVVSPKISCGK